ncbi:MAG: EFR1 family ferrodoxin [Candidatus Odinarchaeota archaeon]
MKIALIYFSATGVTEEYAKLMAHKLEKRGNKTRIVNILIPENRSKIIFIEFDAFIFGFPVFDARLPTVAEDWLQTINVRQKRCSMFFTYGARALELAHQVGYHLLREAGFEVVLSAEFLGRHSFNVAEGWSLAEDRPNAEDRQTAKEFAEKSFERFMSSKVDWNYELEDFTYQKQEHGVVTGLFSIFYPLREEKECSMCKQCEEECPAKAFDATTGVTDKELCILCMHCVYICPDGVIEVGDATELYQKFKKHHKLTDEVVMNKKSKIIY